MVNYCAIIGCNRTGGKDKVSFFRLPAVITNQGEKTQQLSEKRRRLWISRISRSDLQPASYPFIRVCSDHFVNGKYEIIYNYNKNYDKSNVRKICMSYASLYFYLYVRCADAQHSLFL